MNNNNNWTNTNQFSRESQRGSRKNRNGRGAKNNRGRNSKSLKEGHNHFKKFADYNHSNPGPNNWSQKDWNCSNRDTNYHNNGSAAVAGIFPWIRKSPVNPLIIPQHISFDEQYESNQDNAPSTETDKPLQSKSLGLVKEAQDTHKATDPSKIEGDSRGLVSETSQLPKAAVTIKQESDLLLNLKKEKCISSSSSSSESSSSEDEMKNQNKTTLSVKPEIIPIPKPPTSPLNIKLRPRSNSVLSTPVKLIQKSNASSSSSSSSSSDEESSCPSPLPVQTTTNLDKRESRQKLSSTQGKGSSEDEVVCIGSLENQIILEDESENTSKDDDTEEVCNEGSEKILNTIPKKDAKTTSEKCMICDKKGHTSFQCQMICKNCSAPYHGYRTCTQPANLNTMMQLFMEFCMQQLQNFKVEQQPGTNTYDSVTMPQVEFSNLINVINKTTNKLKRKNSKTNETYKKNKASKKRKISAMKKTKSKANSSDISSDDSKDTESETTSTETDSDSSAESLVSSKKKHKMKTKNASKSTLSLSDFSANPVNLPMVLNGFPHLSVPPTPTQNPSTSTNALNTLLLTQMFQNAIGSLKTKKNK